MEMFDTENTETTENRVQPHPPAPSPRLRRGGV